MASAARPPRQHSAASRSDSANITDPMPGQTEWSVENLPDILYVFKPSTPQVRTQTKLPTKPSPWPSGPELRIFDILPDRISSNVEEFRVEAWMRLDRRIQLHDITDRMNPKFRIKTNALQQRSVRFRQAFRILSWGSGNKKTGEHAEEIEKELEALGIDVSRNTTRGLTPGLKDPVMGEAGGRIEVPASYAKRFKEFAAEQEEMLRKLGLLQQPVRTPQQPVMTPQQPPPVIQDMIHQSLPMQRSFQPVMSATDMRQPNVEPSPFTYSSTGLLTQFPVPTPDVTYAQQHRMSSKDGEYYQNQQGISNVWLWGVRGIAANNEFHEDYPYLCISPDPIQQDGTDHPTADETSDYLHQDMQDNAQGGNVDSEMAGPSEGNDGEVQDNELEGNQGGNIDDDMTDDYQEYDADGESEQGQNIHDDDSEWTEEEPELEPDKEEDAVVTKEGVPIIPLDPEYHPGIPYIGEPQEEAEPGMPKLCDPKPPPNTYPYTLTVTERNIAQIAHNIAGTMDSAQYVARPSISHGMLAGPHPLTIVDTLDFNDFQDVPTDYELMERALRYHREYDIDIEYCQKLRDQYAKGFSEDTIGHTSSYASQGYPDSWSNDLGNMLHCDGCPLAGKGFV
ncbi:hypothetical protein AJ79_07990 [Helicocarpus griseus UAMH5409]|uniref:Uncharacterized protein n=1 Tax=Helicocarpus griseus UAMH5409 TaxID=1447875 RepID=A0A2B7WXB1_9EURO|nr:hypothetical protein AJ79_07990 [Helicocarpus griseus UAMH5409]